MTTIDTRFARKFLQGQHAAVNRHDADAIAAMGCDDVIWEISAAPHTALACEFAA